MEFFFLNDGKSFKKLNSREFMEFADILNVQNFTQPDLGFKKNLRQKERKFCHNLNHKKLP